MSCLASEDTLKPLRLELAVGLWPRIRGLLGSAVCDSGEVLALVPCKSIHTFGMREAIDVAFINRQGQVLKTRKGLSPGCLLFCKGAVCVLERRSMAGKPWFEPGETVALMVW